MGVFNKNKITATVIFVTTALIFSTTLVFAALTRVDLLTATNFAILGATAITSVPTSTIVGNVGLSPAAGSNYSGLTSGQVTGTIYAVDASGPAGSVNNPGLLTTAKNDLTTAYLDAAGRTPATVLVGSDNQLGGQTLTAGIYSFGHASSANIVGTVTLDAQGDPNAVFIFQASSDFVTASGSVVNLINGAQPCNVFWQVTSSATLGTGSNFVGSILALVSVTDSGGSTVHGRLLARNGAVSINNTTVIVSTCSTTTTATSSASGASSSSAGGGAAPFCADIPDSVVAPIIVESRRLSPTSIFLSWAPYSGVNIFNVEYGPTNGNWLYNTDVTGFSTTLNALPSNQPVWARIAARSDCTIGTYGGSMLIGGPGLPNTGFDPGWNSVFSPWMFLQKLIRI